MKLSKQTILIGISTLVVAGAGLAYYFITRDKEDVLGWKDGSWLYRKSIAVANSGAELINEEVLIEVDTASLISASKLENTCADLRFTDSDDNTYLAYWVEGGCNTATTQVWVRIPSLTAGGKTIYMYYGNPAAGNNEEAWAGKFILMKDTACDSGWTAESASGGDFYQRFPLGSAAYGTTGGSSSHDHGSYVLATSTVSTGTNTSTNAGLNQAGAHSHNNVTYVTQTASNVIPPYLNMIFCSNNKLVVKQNAVAVFDTTVPSGFTRFAALDSKFPRGEATYGGTSTTSTHLHSIPAVTTSGLSASRTCPSGTTAVPSSTHTHTFATFNTGSATQIPVYKNVIYGEADADIKGSSGIIMMTNTLPPMGWTQYSALDSYFPYGSASFGTTGGTATHNHTIATRTSGAYSGAVTCTTTTPRVSLPRAHTHTTPATNTNDASNNPPYIETIFIQKKTSQSITFNGEEMKNEAPTEPTSLYTEGSTNPDGVGDFTPEFSAVFNDPNPIDSASYYQIEVNTASDFTGTVMWDSTQTSISPEVANSARSQDISYAGSALQEGTTYYWRIMFWDNSTSQGILSSPWSATGQFTMNITPNAPTDLLTEGSVNPINVSDTTPEFSAIFSDSNSSDVGSYYQIEVNTASDFSGTVMWDSTQTALSPTVANSERSQDISYAGTTLQEGITYYWRISFWDNAGTQSPQSSTAQFMINTEPNAPTSLLTEGATDPTNLTNFIPKFNAIFSDPNTSNVGSHYQIEVSSTSDFSGTPIWDSTQTSLTPTIVNGARSQDISYAGPTLYPYITYYWRIKFWDNHGLEGAWSSTAQFSLVVTTWQNANLQYKMPVIAANTSGSTLTNEDILVQIDTAALITAGKMQADCDDIRFYDGDDTTALQYWVEGKCNTSSTQIWVRIPSLPNGGKTIYMYYGNPEAVNDEETWTGNIIMFADATCPTGWTRASDLDNKFLYGGTTYGTTGGGNSHTHSDAICTSSSINTTSIAGTIGGALTGTTITHTHTSLRATLLSATVVPPYEGMIACYSNTFLFSQGLISIFDTSAPSGWTRYSELDDRFVQAQATYGETGGSDTHTHSTTTGYTTGTTGDTQTLTAAFTATGGTITYAGGYTIHTFTTGGTFAATGSGNAEILVVGGGGGGGADQGGGGGAGGYVYSSSTAISTGNYSITIGNGGAGASAGTANNGSGGGSSTAFGYTAGGGAGGYGFYRNGQSGGNSGSGTTVYIGGSAYGDISGGAGGASVSANGGNASSFGKDSGSGYAGSGAAGLTLMGISFGGGGGGGNRTVTQAGTASFGGGNGGYQTNGANGTANTGGGGGGGSWNSYQYGGGTGGTGIVVVKYLTQTAGGYASGTHTHLSTSATPSTVSNLPPYLDVVFAKADTDQYVAGNNVLATSALPPLGWSRFTELDNKFPRGASTYGSTGGASTHVHDVTVDTGEPSATVDGGGTGTNYADSTHTHSCTTASDTGSNLPSYTTVIFAQRKASQATSFSNEQLGNLAPDAPTNLLTEGQTNPTEITNMTPKFSAIFTDTDATDSAIAYQIQVSSTSDFSGGIVWDSGQTTLTEVPNGNRSQDITYGGTTLSQYFTYYWRIKFWDNNSKGSRASTWSANAHFSTALDSTSWEDPYFQYKIPILVINSESETLSNEDVLVQIDTAALITAGKMQNDCDDMRFYDGDDTTQLQYWVEGKCNTDSTQIWVRIPSLPEGGKAIFMYYGSPEATNAEENWTGNVIMFADTTCPAGWTRAADLDNKFLYGGTTYGTTGGGTSHTHSDAICTSSSINTTSVAGTIGGALTATTITHTHTSLRATLLSTTVVPPYEGMIACYSNTFLFSQGLISMFDTDTPSGWTRFSSLDDRFVQAKDTYGETGGSTTHTHSTTTGYTTGTTTGTQTIANPFSATGGTITYTDSNGLNPRSGTPYAGGYTVHTFTSSGTFSATGTTNADILLVAGGGGGGQYAGGGGGGGGVLYQSAFSLSTNTYSITVGNGATSLPYYNGFQGYNGENSVFSTLTAYGGGGGGGRNYTTGRNGGSGGGGASYLGGAGTGVAGQGNNGASGGSNGGGGAGQVGQTAGNGGNGVANSISGNSVYYGGGGSGNGGGTGGAGGGGSGRGGSGTNGLGGGGAGVGEENYPSGLGGSGVVIIRYLTIPIGGGSSASSTHTHTSTSATSTTVSNLPPYLDMVFAKANTDQYVSGNNIVATSAVPPLGWDRFTALDNKFPRGATTYGTTGGATTHVHDTTINTGVPSATIDGGGTGTNYADSTHTHSCTTTSDAGSNMPSYSTVIYAQRKISQELTFVTELIGNTPPNAPTNLLTEGQTNPTELDDINPEFSAIFTDSDATDSAIHYQIQVNTSSSFTGEMVWDSTQTSLSPSVSNGARSQDISYAGSTLNPYFTYYWRIRFWDNNSIGSINGAWSSPASFSVKTTTWGLFDNWYRYPIVAGNSTGSTLTNEDVLVELDTATLIGAGKMQADCDDIRFLDGDDTTSLEYWIEGKCNTSSTQIWVRVPSLPNGGKTIFMYYGDPNAINAEEEWTGNVIMFADTTCPTGWTRAEDLDNKFLYGGTTYGTTGGGTTHTHSEATCTSTSINTTSVAGTSGGALGGSTTTHTHTSLRATLLSATVVPPYAGMIACYSNTFLFSQGLISMFNTSTPSGWTRYSELDSKFVEANATYGETGGAATHTHSTTTGYTTGTASATQTLLNSFSTTGGTVTTSGSYTIHTFTSSGTFTVAGSGTVDVLVVAGGAGGGPGGNDDNTQQAWGGAGGRGGQVVYSSSYAVSSGSISVTVGGGGANSAFGSISATTGAGASGGTAGGTGGPGGTGTYSDINGTGYYYGGGGGGGAGTYRGVSAIGGAGGTSGGGRGGDVGYCMPAEKSCPVGNTAPGVANTGGGGGGGAGAFYIENGQPGGSGIVIVRRLTPVGSSGTYASSTHTHNSANATPTTVSNLPPYLDVVFAKANTDQYVTGSNIIATNSIPPLGWARFAALDNKFPRGASTYGTSGGATTHVHDTTITAGIPSGTTDGGGTGTNYADSTHTHSCSVTSDTGSNMPSYSTVIYAQKKTSQTITFGSEQIGNITPSIPGNPFVEGLSNPLNVTDTTPEFSAIYTDGNVADIARYYQIQVNTTADFTGTVMWDSTKTEYIPGVTNGNRSQDVSYAGSSLNAGSTYYWRIKFWDDNSIGSKESDWSVTSSFIMQAPPNTPTSLQTNGATNPTVLTREPPLFTAIYSDANSDNATAYQIEVNTSPLFTGTVMWDSGKVATTVVSGQRSSGYEYSGTFLTNSNATLYWHIRFWDTIDAVSEWSNVAQFQDTVTHTYYEGLKLNGLKLD